MTKKARPKVKAVTPWARQVWRLAYSGEPWPKSWRVEWVGFMRGALGLTLYRERRVLLSLGDRKRHNPIATLVHEFIHMRCGPSLRHGREFQSLERAALLRVWP